MNKETHDQIAQDARTKLLAVRDKVAVLQHESTRVLDRIDKHLNRGKLPRLNSLGEFQNVSMIEATIGAYTALHNLLEDYPVSDDGK